MKIKLPRGVSFNQINALVDQRRRLAAHDLQNDKGVAALPDSQRLALAGRQLINHVCKEVAREIYAV